MYIYTITNLITNKKYVGMTIRPTEKSKYYFGSGVYIKRAIKKYGRAGFKKDIIELCNSEEELKSREIYWISELNTKFPVGYNLTDGGEGVHGLLEETREAMNAKLRLLTGEKSSRFGAKLTEEHKQKLRVYNTGKVISLETREKIRVANLGKKMDINNLEKLRQANIGKSHNKEWNLKVRLGQPNSCKVDQFSKSGEFIATYVSISEAVRQTIIASSSIVKCCKGELKTAGKYVWKYSENV